MVSYRKGLNHHKLHIYLGQCLRAFVGEEDAVVTVFLLSVGAALLTLFLAVFNYGRFLMAEKQTEQALASSLASVLSYYEPKLAKELGLFALDTQDMGLPDVGKAYFVDNLGAAGAINGQECLAYTLRFPAHGRLSESQLLADQAIDARRIEGWVDAGQDLLMALGVSDWQNLLSVSGMGLSFGAGASGAPGTGYGGAQAGYGESGGYGDAGYGSDSEGSEGGAEEKPEWMTKMEDNLYSDTGARVRFWQFLSTHPPKGAFVDRGMPAGIGAAGYWQADDLMGGGALDAQADFWSDAFLSPSSVVKDETFLSKMTTQLSEFLSAIQGSLTGTLSKGRDKLLFTEYLLHELDFATNKPVMDRYFPRCEVEYVICGFDNAWDNLRNVALRIFLLRSSLHFLDSLMSSVEMNEAALVVALMEGVIKGSADVEKLFAGERVPSFPGVQGITLSYKDHLRLFLLCQSEEAHQKALQGLVQANLWYWANGAGAGSGALGGGGAGAYALSRYCTEVRGTVETELSLWPFGSVRIRREGAMGYDYPFALLPQE